MTRNHTMRTVDLQPSHGPGDKQHRTA